MSKFDNSYLIKLILEEYQKVFLEIGNHEIEKNGTRYGIPPKSIVVKYHDVFNTDEFKIGSILSVWRVFYDRIDYLCDLDTEPIKDPKDGMYFNEGLGYFSFNEMNNEIQFEWYVGPRYGRGFVYKIIDIEGKIEVIQDRLIWVS